jgi:hypothetical protein
MASGKLLLRISELRHLMLQSEARDLGISVSELCRCRVESPSAMETLPAEIATAIQAAQAAVASSMLGIVLFGSYARGSHTDASDIDLLIILDPEVKINRTLYRSWQNHAQGVERCEPHFVSLPDPEKKLTGLWAEIAIDGQILWERNNQIQYLLVKIRRAIIEGKLVSKKVHGQTYWLHTGVA